MNLYFFWDKNRGKSKKQNIVNYFLRLGIQHRFKLHITLLTKLIVDVVSRRFQGPSPVLQRSTETLLVLPRSTGEGRWNLQLTTSTISLVSNVICNIQQHLNTYAINLLTADIWLVEVTRKFYKDGGLQFVSWWHNIQMLLEWWDIRISGFF